MQVYQGIPVGPGIAIANARVERSADWTPPRRAIAPQAVGDELKRFHGALQAAREELEVMAQKSGLDTAVRSIAASHREFLSDPTLLKEVEDAIRNGQTAADWATFSVFRRWIEKFRALEDEFFRQRYVDLLDLKRRVLRHLAPVQAEEASTDRPAVLVAEDLTPSQVAELDRTRLTGLATALGGATSHTAIVARSLGIPAVFGIGHATATVQDGTLVIVDGDAGRVITEPDAETLDRYRELRSRAERRARVLRRVANLRAETPDGWPISVYGNIEFPFEVEEAVKNGAEGIGLYRTEFMYLDRNRFPDEETHLREYRRAISHLQGRSLVIRTFDFGADKFAGELGMPQEPNPFLGCRSLRYSFARPELFRTQLRAILRASAEGKVRVMLPMISDVSELRRANRILDQIKEELRQEHQPFDRELRVGIMVEIPSAAVSADVLAAEVDFFSVGTNDLTQYTLAVDRTNERVAALYRPSNPALLRLLRHVIREGERAGIPVSMCGEMACERPYTLVLLGLGIRTFSVTPTAVPEVKRVVRAVPFRTAAAVARQALELKTSGEVDDYLAEEAARLIPEA